MPFLTNIEQKIKKNEVGLKTLINEIEELQKNTQKLFSDLNICPEKFSDQIDNPENFSEAEWDRLQDYKKKLDEKLDLSQNYAVDPAKASNTRLEMQMSQNWLFVK